MNTISRLFVAKVGASWAGVSASVLLTMCARTPVVMEGAPTAEECGAFAGADAMVRLSTWVACDEFARDFSGGEDWYPLYYGFESAVHTVRLGKAEYAVACLPDKECLAGVLTSATPPEGTECVDITHCCVMELRVPPRPRGR